MDARRLDIEIPGKLAEIVNARIASERNASENENQEALELLAEQDAPLEERGAGAGRGLR